MIGPFPVVVMLYTSLLVILPPTPSSQTREGRGAPVAVQFRRTGSPAAAVTLDGSSRNEGETGCEGEGVCEDRVREREECVCVCV